MVGLSFSETESQYTPPWPLTYYISQDDLESFHSPASTWQVLGLQASVNKPGSQVGNLKAILTKRQIIT